MSFSIVHLSDPHFGDEADLPKIEAVGSLVPDLQPSLVVVTGDLTVRARHGEFQAARGWLREFERSAPVYVIPGNHDVQWWRRPLLPFGRDAQYEKFKMHFGPVLAPTFQFPELMVAGVVTSHGLTWGSLTPHFRDLSVMGHLPQDEIRRVAELFRQAKPEQARVLVLHHNILRGVASGRMGLTRWQKVHRWLMHSGADMVLCGHDHQGKADVMGGVVISTAGTLSTRRLDGATASFHRIVLEDDSIQLELYEWEEDVGRFRRTDMHGFARRHTNESAGIPTGAV